MKVALDIQHTRPPRKPEIYEALQAALDSDTDECIIWQFGKNERGYGILAGGKKNKRRRVHVVICEHTHGLAPTPKHQAGHRCGVSACYNPRHLRWVTRAENEADKILHGTHNQGERNGMSRFTAQQILEIRTRYEAGELQRTLAVEFDCTQGRISEVVNFKIWKEVK
jgi:HNH endonuclease